ncbi:MAG: glycine--tRNA ligase subunit beta [Alphaproteobacteria bacterium]|nr:glycine--tRNA ligase subunit beta [Alphaproteobacteria bacterium]
MQNELLLEFFSEEIPARFQRKAIVDAQNVFTKILQDYGAEFDAVETYVSPRRIAIRVSELKPQTKDLCEEKRGPRLSAPERAIDGFLKSNGKKKSELVKRDGYYFLNVETKGVSIPDLIPEMIEDFIANMPWQKSMRWYIEEERSLSAFWVRPMRSILCIFDGKVIETYIKSVGLTTCGHTFGHRFLAPGSFLVSDFKDYVEKLEKNHVILDFFKKRELIDRELTQRAAAMGLIPSADPDLLDEVTGLVEFPFIHIGTIEEQFMKLPSVVLSTSMRVHQKYFTMIYPGSVIAPFFETVLNVPETKVMSEGLERVLRARLSDAAFFFKEDTDATLEAFAQRLSNVVFHEKLGSMAQKVDRMMSIADSKDEHRTIALCKADLMSQMVGEFPELQGVMGEIYAAVQEEEPAVCKAIREHYKPLAANDSLPETQTGARVAFFDKLDTLVGFLGIGIYPTGSKDPFALRRAALCIVRLLCDFDGDVLTGEKLSWYIETLVTAYSDQGVALEPETIECVEKFIIERLKVYMSDKLDINVDVVEATISSFDTLDFDYKVAVAKAKRLADLSGKVEFSVLKEAYKRACGVIGDVEVSSEALNALVFKDDNMLKLQEAIVALGADASKFSRFIDAAQALLTACDNVLINDPSPEIRIRNLQLLKAFTNLVEENIGKL